MVSVTPLVTVTSPVTSTFWLHVVLVVICPLTVETHPCLRRLRPALWMILSRRATTRCCRRAPVSTATGPSTAAAGTRVEIRTAFHTCVQASCWSVKITWVVWPAAYTRA